MRVAICFPSALSVRDGDGRIAFRGESSGVIFHEILDRDPVPPIRLNPDLPPKLEEVINKALEKDRNLRYQDAADLRADLQRLKRDTDSGRIAVSAIPTATVVEHPADLRLRPTVAIEFVPSRCCCLVSLLS
jgi:eukaryotic-like serine/threonine-protein kinase